MTYFTKRGLINAVVAGQWRDLLARGGATLTSNWTSGSGRHTSKRQIPPLCEMFNVEDAYPSHVERVFLQHPRAQRVIAIINPDYVRQLLTICG